MFINSSICLICFLVKDFNFIEIPLLKVIYLPYYGISNNCTRKKEAWEFLRQYFFKETLELDSVGYKSTFAGK